MTISRDVLKKYISKANVFIETGTHIGVTTQIAVELGFKKIYTIELADHFYQAGLRKFAKFPQVTCIHGDSTEQLKVILSNLQEPALFWLDGHWSMGDTAKGNKAVPLYEELEVINKHHVKTHTLLIDDLRLMGNKDEQIQEWHQLSVHETKRRCSLINPNYRFSLENGFVPNDILVAQI